ncbi:transposase [Kitasatospora sp. RG8]|uniref:transposase n=1 Tax=Kitasatospora sp. RG8 TaxID=2820815 RepID=UPI001FD75B76|nr:transposase [Kitasatospora sp. RG8]
MPSDQKAAIVLSILAGETTAAEAARSAGVTGQAISNWKRRFIEAGCGGLEATSDPQASREAELREEIARLKGALGDSYLQLQAIRQSMRPRAGAGGPARAPLGGRGRGEAHALGQARLNGVVPAQRSASGA